MARNVKCSISGEYGKSDVFIKIGNRYYKTQEIYDIDEKNKNIRKEIIDYLCIEFLDYQNGQPFPPILPRKLKELEFYDNEIILEAFRQKHKDIRYWLDNKKFDNDTGRVSYIFAIIKNSIADIKRQFDYSKRQAQKVENKNLYNNENLDINIIGSTASAKNISNWLEGDDD